MPCNVDIATQEILKLAEAADPKGTRTMGVLTKPDLATENATRDAIIDLVGGRKNYLKLGYYVVKNRSADDSESTLVDRAMAEKAFFMAPPWTTVRDRCGIAALEERLRHILMKISKQEFPHVKAEIEQRLRKCKEDLDSMGPARMDHSSQRQYLGELAVRFQTTARAALNGHYAGEKLFRLDPNLKLITRMMKLHKVFAEIFSERAHTARFDESSEESSTSEEDHETDSDDSEEPTRQEPTVPFEIPLAKYCELHDIIIAKAYRCPKPESKLLMARITEVFDSCRGPDLGTVSWQGLGISWG